MGLDNYVIGLRSFDIIVAMDSNEPRLMSSGAFNLWIPGTPNKARCMYPWRKNWGDFSVNYRCAGYLSKDCSCGIYSVKESITSSLLKTLVNSALIVKLASWGKIQEHELGYRAEFAYPVSFEGWMCPGCGGVLKNVPVGGWCSGRCRSITLDQLKLNSTTIIGVDKRLSVWASNVTKHIEQLSKIYNVPIHFERSQ